jgi:hypothetical protein
MTEPREPEIQTPETDGRLPPEEEAAGAAVAVPAEELSPRDDVAQADAAQADAAQADETQADETQADEAQPGEAAAAPVEAAPAEDEPLSDEAAEADARGGGELLAAAHEWGYVDEEGNIRLKAGDRVVGQMKGNDPDKALRSLAHRYQQLAGKVATLEREMEPESNKVRFLPRVEALLQAVPTAEAVGDLDALSERLTRLHGIAQQQLEENLRKKEELCARAEELAESTDWKATADAMKGLQAEWKAVGSAPKEKADEVWTMIRRPPDRFFERRNQHLETHDQSMRENIERKEALCARAEELAGSTDWKLTAEAMKGLQDEWKAVGPVPQHRSTELWNRFRAAMDQFFQRRKEFYDRLEKEQRENLRSKEALCVRAEELAESTEWRETGEALKGLQAEWKSIGPVPRKKAETLWARFHGACDRFFTRRSAHFDQNKGDRDRRQTEWRDRLQESLERKREQADRLNESIGRDEENLDRWRSNLGRLRPGQESAETRASLEEKISDVETRVQSKRSRLEELEASIQEISAKL